MIEFKPMFLGLLPALTNDEYEELKADIEKRGVQVPIIIDEDDNLIDGFHRMKIANELGIDEVPAKVVRGLSEDEKKQLAWDLNAHRRHMTKEKRQKLAAKLRESGMSYPAIGEKLGISHVQAMRDVTPCTNVQPAPKPVQQAESLESSEPKSVPFQQPQTITGRDGKAYPATKKPRPRNKFSGILDDKAKEREEISPEFRTAWEGLFIVIKNEKSGHWKASSKKAVLHYIGILINTVKIGG